MRRRFPGQRSTPAGAHRPVLLNEVLAALALQPGQTVVDATLGAAGHSVELLRVVGPTGRLIACDFDADTLPAAQERLAAVGHPFTLHHGNYAGLATVLAEAGVERVDAVLADVGISSMQIDDAARGFSYMRPGPLDMRMDRTRGRSAAELLTTLPTHELADAFREFGDEPQADAIARAIVARRSAGPPLSTTTDLTELIQSAAPVQLLKGDHQPSFRQQRLRPVARVFQALRILVNRELANLQQLLRLVPTVLVPGGRVAIISFHSGEDRLVKTAFKAGLQAGVYQRSSPDPVLATPGERYDNPRSRSAKLRWAVTIGDT
jgi:16S rRNA (cytosine1402-N4)-methyltransferase